MFCSASPPSTASRRERHLQQSDGCHANPCPPRLSCGTRGRQALRHSAAIPRPSSSTGVPQVTVPVQSTRLAASSCSPIPGMPSRAGGQAAYQVDFLLGWTEASSLINAPSCNCDCSNSVMLLCALLDIFALRSRVTAVWKTRIFVVPPMQLDFFFLFFLREGKKGCSGSFLSFRFSFQSAVLSPVSSPFLQKPRPRVHH